MQQSSSFLFCHVLSSFVFWQKRSRDQPEPAPDRGTDQQNRRSTAELEQHSTAGHVCLRGNLPNICCLLKQKLNHPQASRHCQETLSKCSWHEPRAARLTHTLSLFCFCVPVTSKMSHGVNKLKVASLSMWLPKACAATRLTSFEIHKTPWTQLDVAGKSSAFFSFESATACWLWEPWRPGPPHLANFRLDALIVVFSGSDSFSRIWSHAGERERERERERGGGGGQRLNRTYRWRELRFQ